MQFIRALNADRLADLTLEFRLTGAEMALVMMEVPGPGPVMSWVSEGMKAGGFFRLHVDEVTEMYDTIESYAYMPTKSEATRKAMRELVAEMDRMAEDAIWSEAGGRPRMEAEDPEGSVPLNQPCPCGSGKKYKKCCGRL